MPSDGSGPVRVVDYLVSCLRSLGVRHVFGVGGANIEDFYDALFHSGGAVRGVLAKHEFSAATMAEGYSRVSNQLGVVVATSGGGAMNLVAGLAESRQSRVPVLALVGQPSRASEGRGAFQDQSGLAGSMNAHDIFSGVTRWCARVDHAASMPTLLPQAVAAARQAPEGPAVLLLPKDVQQETIRSTATEWHTRATAGEDESSQADALRALEAARYSGKGVVIIAGDGVARADARTELANMASALGAHVAVTPDAKDVFDNHDPRFVGVTGVMGHPTASSFLQRATACVLVGTRLPLMARAGLEEALAGKTTVCVGADRPFPGLGTELDDVVMVGSDIRSELQNIVDGLGADTRHRAKELHCHGPEFLSQQRHPGHGVSLHGAMLAVASVLPSHANVVCDAGNTGASAVHLLPAPREGRFVVALGMGGMGYSFGAGIGAAFATGQRTYVLAGDGAFYMHGLEIHTAVEYDLPITFVVFNNNAHGMCVTREQLYYQGNYTFNRFQRAHIASGVAAMFPSLPAKTAASVAELRSVLADTNDTDSPAFVSVAIDPDEIPPFTPFRTQTHRAADANTPWRRGERNQE